MRSVRDSFDSDGEFLPDIESRDAATTSQKKKASARGNTILKGTASGFKRASELLRDAEVAKLGFEAGLDGKNGLKPAETPEAGRNVQDNAKSKSKIRVSPVKKSSSSTLDAETAESPVIHTSRYFTNDSASECHAQSDTAIFKQQIQTIDTHSSRGIQRRAKNEKTVINLTESHETNLSSKLENDGTESKSNTVKEKKKQNVTEDDQFRAIDSVPVARGLISASPIRSTVDLTTEDGALEVSEEGASKTASIIQKHSYGAQDSIATDSRGLIKSKGEETTKQVVAPDFSMDRLTSTKTISPTKKKSPVKKKQLTVTEKALDEFRPEEIGDSLPIQEYFPMANHKKENKEMKKTNRAKSRTKLVGNTRKAEKKSSLLAPTDALQSLHGQYLMFGTSSQLLQHSSSPNHQQNNTSQEHHVLTPNLSRDDSFIDIDLLLENPTNMLGLKSTRSLWSAATRDDNGTLMNAEVLATPNISIAVQNSPLTIATKPVSESNPQARDPDMKEAHGTTVPPSVDILGEIPLVVKAIPVLPRSLGEAATKQRQTSRSPVKKKRKTKDLVVRPEDAFKKVSVVDLKAELKSFGCKPPRSKAKMIELILECRANQNKPQEAATETVQSEPVPNQNLQVSIATSTKPQDNVDVGLDPAASDVPVADSSQSKRKRMQVKNLATDSSSDNLPPPSFQVPPEDKEDELSQAQLDALMSGIHRAIMTQPPTHSITNPSWKEKMAMYDPIVLEELTAWLNTGGLDAVGIDTEVWPTLVRDWCESKSVCFIWTTEGWRKKRA